METKKAGNVTMLFCEDFIAAQQKSAAEAANTGGVPLPFTIFLQGDRYNLAGALPVPFARTRLEVKAAKKGANVQQARLAINRPEIPDHAKSIARYLRENFDKSYILPPLTLNVQGEVNFYTIGGPSDLKLGYLVLPATSRLAITDGQHRIRGLQILSESLDDDAQIELDRNCIAVMITCEQDVERIHQDFADCSKTKALPPSLLAAYDMRNAANGIVYDLVDRCSLFKDKIDSTSTTLGAKSYQLFLLNAVRQMVKEMLCGNFALKDIDFATKAKSILGDRESKEYEQHRTKFIDFVEAVTLAIPVWAEIATLPPGIPTNRIPELRKEGWICLSATGLNIIGSVGHRVFKDDRRDWQPIVDKLGNIDWRREAKIWQGNVVDVNGRKNTRDISVREAKEEVALAVSLPSVAA